MSILQHGPEQVKSTRPWEAAVRVGLAEMGYGSVNVAAICDHIERYGDASSCQFVFWASRERVNALVADAMAAPIDDEDQSAGDAEGPAESWPEWTDLYRWLPTGPTEEDDAFWAEHSPANASGYTVISRAVPPAPPSRPRRLAGNRVVASWSDADQLRHHGCV